MVWNQLRGSFSRIRLGAGTGRTYSSQEAASASSKHSEWYRDIIPGMIPIALLGSSVYLVRGLSLAVVTEQTVEFVRRAYSLHAQNCHTRNRLKKPRNMSPSLRRVLNSLSHRSGTCLLKRFRNLPRNPGGGEGRPKRRR